MANKLKKYFYQEIWNIGIYHKQGATTIDKITNICQDNQIHWLTSKYHFQADPVIVEHNGQLYVFYEALNHTWVKGHLHCRVLNEKLEELDDFAIDDVNALGCHLSFPQIYQIDNHFYMMPESHENQAIYLFIATDFPKHWQKITTISNKPCIDSVLYQDVQNQRFWVISNDQKTLKRHIFTSNSLAENWQEITLGKQSVENQHQRLGGSVINIDNQLYLPIQEHNKEYGKSLFIKKIQLPTLDEKFNIITDWQEKTVSQIISKSDSYPDGIHTLNSSQNYIIIDAKRWAFQPFNFFIRKYRQILQTFYHLKQQAN